MYSKSTIGCLPPPRHVEIEGRDLSPPTDKAGRLSLQHQTAKRQKSTHHHQKANEHFIQIRVSIKHAAAAADGKETDRLFFVGQPERARKQEAQGWLLLEYAQAERERSSNQPAHPGHPGQVHILK